MTQKTRRRLPRRLASYALSAGASLLANESVASIIYTGLGSNGVTGSRFEIDLNQDSFVDLKIHFAGYSDPCTEYDENCVTHYSFGMQVSPSPLNAIFTSYPASARRFEPGEQIGGQAIGNAPAWLAARADQFFFRGGFADARPGFAGIAFQDAAHRNVYGWLELQVESGFREVTLFGYAYETTPGKSITAGAIPEPPSLLLLAGGAAGLAALRRKRAKRLTT